MAIDTSVKQQVRGNTWRRWAAALGAGVAMICGASCGNNRDVLEAPQVLVSPYDQSQGDALWAVVPLGNESGVSSVDTYMIADKLVAAVDQVRGVACLPVNRTIQVMRARGISGVRTPEEARALAASLGADGLIVGNVTAYDPYDPPTLGLALALYVRERSTDSGPDPMRLQQAYRDDRVSVRSNFESRPAATVSETLDAKSHDVLMQVKNYAQGRHDRTSASGWRGILASMDRYTEFAAYVAVSRLIDQERLRVGIGAPREGAASGDSSPPPAQR